MAIACNTRIVPRAHLRKLRRLNMPGDVLVELGDLVTPETVIAKTEFVRGSPRVVDLNSELSVRLTPQLVDEVLLVRAGDKVTRGQVIARYQKKLWSEISEVRAPCDGVVEMVSRVKGRVVVREDPRSSKPLVVMNVSEKLKVWPSMIRMYTDVQEGDMVYEGQVLASAVINPLIGEAGVDYVYTPMSGVVEKICTKTGCITVVRPIKPSRVQAHIAGVVAEILPDYGAVVESTGAYLEGVFGIGGEKHGELVVASDGPRGTLEEAGIGENHKGRVLLAGSSASLEALRKMKDVGAAGLIVGGINNLDLVQFLGYEINVGLTGQEQPGFTVVVTEGFGNMPVSQGAWELLVSSAGRVASLDGTTHIRAGAIRPQVLLSEGKMPPDCEGESLAGPFGETREVSLRQTHALKVGDRVRAVREPYFGQWGIVEELPAELRPVESESLMEVAVVRLDDTGKTVTIAEANLEVIPE